MIPRNLFVAEKNFTGPQSLFLKITLQHWLDWQNSKDTVPWLFYLLAPCCAPRTRVDIPVHLVLSLNKTSNNKQTFTEMNSYDREKIYLRNTVDCFYI